MSRTTFVRPVAVTAVKYIKKMETGGSNSHLIASKEGKFVVKSKQNRQGPKVLVNELVSVFLALNLLLPCPKATLVNVSPEFIEANQAVLSTFSPGLHFGSEYHGSDESKVTSTFDSQTIKQAHNFNELADIMAFDVWTANTDRTLSNLISYENQILMIDHGHSFTGPDWTAPSLRASVNNSYGWQQPLKEFVNRDLLNEQIKRIKSLDPAIIQAAIDEEPDEWGLTSDDKNSLLEFLIHRQTAIEELLAKAIQ